jgi:hypothetical protein
MSPACRSTEYRHIVKKKIPICGTRKPAAGPYPKPLQSVSHLETYILISSPFYVNVFEGHCIMIPSVRSILTVDFVFLKNKNTKQHKTIVTSLQLIVLAQPVKPRSSTKHGKNLIQLTYLSLTQKTNNGTNKTISNTNRHKQNI